MTGMPQRETVPIAPDDSRKQLGAFLRSRRESLDPQRLGLPRVGRRRTPGLLARDIATLQFDIKVQNAGFTAVHQSHIRHLAKALGLIKAFWSDRARCINDFTFEIYLARTRISICQRPYPETEP